MLVGRGTRANGSGSENVVIGYQAASGENQSGNVVIGHGAKTGAASNKLIIANNETEALVEGDFSAKTIKLNTTKLGFFKTAPASQEKVAAEATNEATAIELANSLRTMVIKTGLMKE